MELPFDSKKEENTVGNFEKEYVRREELRLYMSGGLGYFVQNSPQNTVTVKGTNIYNTGDD